MDGIRIVVAHPHRVIAQALAEGLGEGNEVVGSTTTAGELADLVEDARPRVAVLHLALVESHGPRLIEMLKAAAPRLAVLVVADRADRPQVERTLTAGVDGFTLTSVSLEELHDTIQRIGAGEVVLHHSVASLLVQSVSQFTTGQRASGPVLTPRQEEILQLLAYGLPNKQIARRLGIGVETVKTHVSRMMEKFDVGSRTEIVVWAVREGLLSPAMLHSEDTSPGAPARSAV